jgi:L-threonylcarbamoyladenylate synthase
MVDFENDIIQCLKILREGGLILYPTDTIWGIGCDATNEKAVERIFQLKNRPGEKSMIVLVADEKNILQYVAAPDLRVFDYLKKIKKPTTVIYDGAIGLAPNLIAADGSIAIRICEEEFCKNLIRRFKKPIVSTSANLSGQPVSTFYQQITDEIKTGVDYIVQFRQEDKTPSEPSSVIRWKDGEIEFLRP